MAVAFAVVVDVDIADGVADTDAAEAADDADAGAGR